MIMRQSRVRPMRFHNALRLKMAENWLALGQVEEALHELGSLSFAERKHPEVQRLLRKISFFPSHVVEAWIADIPRPGQSGKA